MKISKVALKNFRPFYGASEINLEPTQDKTIILIGGLNGHGKTSLLLGMLWCLYGQKINDVDNRYRRELKRSYIQFMTNSMNWNARAEGDMFFSVELEFIDVELSELFASYEQKMSKINLKRTYNIETGEEIFDILIGGQKNELLREEIHQNQFIDDYLIPLEAAKFIFFDAEQISELADMSIKEQGGILNDALGKILGLEVYEKLLSDIQLARNELKKGSANDILLDQIETYQNSKNLKTEQINALKDKKSDLEEQLSEIEKQISQFQQNLIKHSAPYDGLDINAYQIRLQDLEEEKNLILTQLHDIIELLPFAIMANNLQELDEQLNIEDEKKSYDQGSTLLDDRVIDFAGKVFYEPSFPPDDITYAQKKFYSEKVERLLKDFFFSSNQDDSKEISFFHDLSKFDVEFINQIFSQIKYSSKERYEQLFNDDIRINNEIAEIKKLIQSAESKLQDEIIAEWREKLRNAEKDRDLLHQKFGECENQLQIQIAERERLDKQLQTIFDKVEVSKDNRKKLGKITKYIEVLEEFIEKQKEEKCKILSEKATTEIKKIMHTQKINLVEVGLLAENKGLEVRIYDMDNREILQSQLSNGEKQIFISTIFKTIVSLSIKSFPMIIDTPLARMDEQHRENILFKYYPTLSDQVIIFPTNSEISRTKKEQLSAFVSRTYTLENKDGKSLIREGYF